jgi:hypothetical protein
MFNSLRPSAAADGSTSGSIRDPGGHLDAAVDAAAEEPVWTLQDFLQETEADETQPQQGQQAASAAGTDSESSKLNSHGRRYQLWLEKKKQKWEQQQIAKRQEWEQQQSAKQSARKRQALQPRRQQQQADSSNNSSTADGMPFAYDMSRWQVRKDWRQGAPNK